MFVVLQTDEFEEWLGSLADRAGRQVIKDRILRIEGGGLGKAKSVGGKVSEIKIDFGPGYRLYFTRDGLSVIILLYGGDKDSQRGDIERAKGMAAQV